MVLAGELLDGRDDLSCFGHTLQLAVNAGLALNAIARLTAASHKIAGHFKHSTVAMGALTEWQKLLNIPEHSLVQDVATRCTSGWQSREWPHCQQLEEQFVSRKCRHACFSQQEPA